MLLQIDSRGYLDYCHKYIITEPLYHTGLNPAEPVHSISNDLNK
ncbi:hypothetical protein BH23THE1_BH23THE1_27950 [soil metagenome]